MTCMLFDHALVVLPFYIVCAVLLARNGLAQVAPLPESEYSALYDLYTATNGDGWHWLNDPINSFPWNFSVANANPCVDSWEGVNCSIIASQYHVTELKLTLHELDGQIPESLGNLVQLKRLDLSRNGDLSGTVPTTLGALTQLARLDLSQCSLVGPALEILPTMTQLVYIDLHLNQFTGSIPEAISNLVQLAVFYFDTNAVGGSIPSSIGTMTNLFWVYFSHNKLTGTIPLSVWTLPRIESFYLEDNQLTGSVPDAIQQAPQIKYLNLSMNLLTGTIPIALGQMSGLLQIAIGENLLHGTLPNCVGNITGLRTLDFSDNYLTGPIPTSLRYLTNLKVISLQNNQMTGPLTDVFSASQTNITTIRLDGNQFTGELPGVLFQLPSLISLSIVSSCLHGTLPENICGATSLGALILYGLTIGDSCRGSGVESFSRRHQAFGGTFPSCLLSMPNLQTLLLSSSGLTGSINSAVSIGPYMRELDLSHNRLSGFIPNSIQNHSWGLLDLSHNKLSGVLHNFRLHQIPPFMEQNSRLHDSVQLTTNRLSGAVPGPVRSMQDISVLAGNLFECKYDRSNLPQNDQSASTYDCSSNTFDVAMYVWIGVIAFIAVTVGYWYPSRKALLSCFEAPKLDLPVEVADKLTQLQSMFTQFGAISQTSWYCVACSLVLMLPCYSFMSQFCGTHTHQYAYIVSTIYNSGVVPFVLDILCLVSIVAIFYYTLCAKGVAQIKISSSTESGTSLQRVYVWVIFAVSNITIVLGVNIAFVYAVLYQGSQVTTVAQVALSVFKLVWGVAVSPHMIRHLDRYFIERDENNHAEPFFGLQLLVALFNNIAIPCLVVMAIDPNCFSDALLPPSVQTVNYVLPVCPRSDDGWPCQKIAFELASLQFTPPFTYSYQCSASFITSYAPTFVYMSVSTVLLSPLLQYTLMYVYPHLAKGSTVQYLVYNIMPRMLLPLNTDATHLPRTWIGAVGVLVNLLTQLGILLTFGAIFPPIAVAMAVSIAAVVYLTRAKMQRFVHTVVDAQLLKYLDIINAECAGVGTAKQILFAGRVLMCYCCVFYTLFLYDALGDKTGFHAAAWVLFVVPSIPFIGYVFFEAYARFTIPAGGIVETTVDSTKCVELQNVVDSHETATVSATTLSILHENVL